MREGEGWRLERKRSEGGVREGEGRVMREGGRGEGGVREEGGRGEEQATGRAAERVEHIPT